MQLVQGRGHQEHRASLLRVVQQEDVGQKIPNETRESNSTEEKAFSPRGQ